MSPTINSSAGNDASPSKDIKLRLMYSYIKVTVIGSNLEKEPLHKNLQFFTFALAVILLRRTLHLERLLDATVKPKPDSLVGNIDSFKFHQHMTSTNSTIRFRFMQLLIFYILFF